MKKFLILAVPAAALMLIMAPAHADHWRGGDRFVFSFGCCGYPYPAYYPYYYSYYYPSYPAYYMAPPPVVYTVPPPSPVIYATPSSAAPVVAADQTSPTFIDSAGRTCRQYQATTPGGAPFGTACLMPDGTWRVVQ